MTTQQAQAQALEFLAEAAKLPPDDRAWLRDVMAAMVADRRGQATPEQKALLAEARRRVADDAKGE